MKKVFKYFIAFSLSITLGISMMGNVSADTILEVDELNYDSQNTPESFLDKVNDGELEYGDTYITKEDIQSGIDIEKTMNSRRMNEEVWTLQSSSTYKAYGPIKGKYKEKLAAGVTKGVKASFSLKVTTIADNITLSSAATFEFQYTRNGPSGTEAVGTNKATHRYFVGVGSAKIMKHNFRITDKYTGKFIRNQTSYVATNQKSSTYGVLGYYNVAKNTVKIRSVSTNNTKTYNEDDFIKKCSTSNCWSYINF